MAGATAFALSQMFTELTGRPVGFTPLSKAPQPAGKALYGVYDIVSGHVPLVVRTEAPLIGSFGGALLGLPNDIVAERTKQVPFEETLRDAMQEVLNIASTLVSIDDRAVFRKMYTDTLLLDASALQTLTKPYCVTQYAVTIKGYTGGGFAILT